MWTDEQKMMWEKLHERTCSMFSVWQLYTALYGDETTVESMNEISGLGFRIVQNCMLHEQIRLAMALTDRAGKGKQTNLSIDRLIQTLPSNVAESIENTLGSITNSMQVLRQHRNRRLLARVQLPVATAIGWLMQPVLTITFGWLLLTALLPILYLRRKWTKVEPSFFGEDIQFLGIAMGISVAVTLSALQVGAIAVPEAHVPQTIQMLTSNILFDGCTLVVTLLLLSRAISCQKWWSIPIAIVSDIILSASFACASLWCGLVGTPNGLTFYEILRILIAKAPQQDSVELGPYFWTMHTVFLPTLLYLSFVGVLWIAKVLLNLARWLLGRGRTADNPLELTAALCGVLIALFAAGSYLCSVLEEALESSTVETTTVDKDALRKSNSTHRESPRSIPLTKPNARGARRSD